MGAARVIARSRLRANLTATLLLVLLAGVGGGLVIASVAGMRRADSAWRSFQADNPDGDAAIAFFTPEGGLPTGLEDDLSDEVDAVAALPGVVGVTRAAAVVGMVDVDDDHAPEPVAVNSYLDNLAPELVGRPIVVDGRMPRDDTANELALDELLADRLGVEAGSTISFTPYRMEELEAASDGRDDDPGGVPREMTVVGVIRGPGDLLPPRTSQSALYSDEPYMLLTPAWHEAVGPDVGSRGPPSRS